MAESRSQQSQQQPPPQRGRFGRGSRSVPGEIVEVQGGHIVRATGRKDRHSKVCTAKGTRDRRVRLSAHTAIQFYDVQDRLGYDRPSKAVDWLIKNAKAAIDELQELPPWHPTPPNPPPPPPPPPLPPPPPPTVNGFLGLGEPLAYPNYTPDLLTSQELRLSLQSFQDPLYHHHHHHHQNVSFDTPAETSGAGTGAYVFNVPQAVPLHSMLGPGSFFTQGGPLQSSNPPYVRAWVDPMALATAEQSVGFASGFCIPTRYRGGEEREDGVSDKPSSASSGSRR